MPIEFKDVFDALVGVTTIVTGWLVKSMFDRPTHEQMRQAISDNQKLNNNSINVIKEDMAEMKESHKAIHKELGEVKEMLYKALYEKKG